MTSPPAPTWRRVTLYGVISTAAFSITGVTLFAGAERAAALANAGHAGSGLSVMLGVILLGAGSVIFAWALAEDLGERRRRAWRAERDAQWAAEAHERERVEVLRRERVMAERERVERALEVAARRRAARELRKRRVLR